MPPYWQLRKETSCLDFNGLHHGIFLEATLYYKYMYLLFSLQIREVIKIATLTPINNAGVVCVLYVCVRAHARVLCIKPMY